MTCEIDQLCSIQSSSIRNWKQVPSWQTTLDVHHCYMQMDRSTSYVSGRLVLHLIDVNARDFAGREQGREARAFV